MNEPPTEENTTHDPDDAPAEIALPACERLASRKVDGADYPEGTEARKRVHEILDVIEEALASDDEVRLQHLASFADPMQGFGGKGDPIRWELSRVERAVRRVEGAKQPERTANRLVFDLELSDPRYGALGTVEVLAHLRKVEVLSSPGAGPGRGRKGVPATLAALMLEAGAHDVTTFEDARRKIENARTPSKKNSSRPRPSEFRRLRHK